MDRKAVALFSGTMNSTVSFFWATNFFTEVKALFFDDGKNKENYEMVYGMCIDFGIEMYSYEIISLPSISSISRLSIAMDFCREHEIFDIVSGVNHGMSHEDCLTERVITDCIQGAISLESGEIFKIHTPLITLTKAEVWELAEQFNILDHIKLNTRDCLIGSKDEYLWGKGCTQCVKCKERSAGYDAYCKKKHELV